jgi:hypothetical protein
MFTVNRKKFVGNCYGSNPKTSPMGNFRGAAPLMG